MNLVVCERATRLVNLRVGKLQQYELTIYNGTVDFLQYTLASLEQ